MDLKNLSIESLKAKIYDSLAVVMTRIAGSPVIVQQDNNIQVKMDGGKF